MPAATPFHKILVANRGEIALRVIRTARALAYRTVAVYSSADRRARHVRAADQAVPIGEALPTQSYLNIEAIIAAARTSGADAVHPGYGFLAESDEFASACVQAGLVFIGPSAEAIRAMADKGSAKRLMRAAGLPCIPGYDGEEQAEAVLCAEAARLGYPLMVKAAAGGGGRGMRIVRAAREFVESLRSARSEARGAFDKDDVILERVIPDARHIEIQVFADRHGNAIHLGERDCSVQRRHQKIIEEAPSPAVPPQLRARMGAAAVAAARAVGYEGAGTVEFLLDAAGGFYFMEMNTRLQVEHAVTESITGLDLVELQLRVASGEPLRLAQDDVRFSGHCIEARLCAEDPGQSFMPQSGVVTLWRTPGRLRVDHALESGAEVPPFYDSMIAKLVSHGSSREEARRKLLHGLEDTVALGIKTNQVFLSNCLRHPVFAAGRATTGFIDAHSGELSAPSAQTDARASVLGAVLIYATSSEAARPPAAPWMAPRLPVALRLALDAGPFLASVLDLGGHRYAVSAGGSETEVHLLELEGHHVRFQCDGLSETAVLARNGTELLLQYRGTPYRIEDRSHASAAAQGPAGGDGMVRASMNGRVLMVHVTIGDAVEAGQPILTLEAMKMEHVHTAAVAGRVVNLHAAPGDQVPARRIVAEIERVGTSAVA